MLLLFVSGLFFAATGCQVQTVSSVQMQIHQSSVDKNGLTRLQEKDELRITCAPPQGWEKAPLQRNMLYLHQQWRSPDRHAGFGIAFIRTPFPFPADTIVWFAKKQYSKDDRDHGSGKLLGEWSDALGRRWFEAENDQYHVKGFAMTHGLNAWLVYSGYRTRTKPSDQEIALAAKAAESVAPFLGNPSDSK